MPTETNDDRSPQTSPLSSVRPVVACVFSCCLLTQYAETAANDKTRKLILSPSLLVCHSAAMNHAGTAVQNIILIGFMGCGKSTVGRELKRILHEPWIDTDQLIEQRAGCSISDIFATQGEEAFRQMETDVLQDLLRQIETSTVISTGGGAVLREENRDLLQKLGYVVWLRADAELIYQRTKKNRDRPILQTPDPRAVIRELLATREPIYRQCAHLVIDVAGLSRSEIAVGIRESARYHFHQSAE
jgi:shikimate kinase